MKKNKYKPCTKGHRIKKCCIAGIAGYTIAATLCAVGERKAELEQNRKSCSMDMGRKRAAMDDIKRFQLYSEEEIAEKPELRSVELLYFPAPCTGKKEFIIFVPGGAYLECNLDLVANPGAATANSYGYPAFALRYRVRHRSEDYAPINDFAKAIEFIMKNADELNVKTENYMLTGFSAGGNLAGLYGTREIGYGKYGLPKPACITLAYPWTNITAAPALSWNLIKMGYLLAGRELALGFMVGRRAGTVKRNSLFVHDKIDKDYPPCYIIHGERDYLVPVKKNSEKLREILEKLGIRNKYRKCPELTHGFGLGTGTSAEGWQKESIDFWEEVKKKHPETGR